MARPAPLSCGPAIGTLFSTRQATVQAWQAVHLSRSMTMPQRGIGLLLVQALTIRTRVEKKPAVPPRKS